MVKALITAGTYTAGTNIPLTLYRNTNKKALLNTSDNTINLYTTGLWNVKANVVVTQTSTDAVALQLYANGTPVQGATSILSPGVVGNTDTLNINDVVITIPTVLPESAKLSLQLTTGATLVGGSFIVEYL